MRVIDTGYRFDLPKIAEELIRRGLIDKSLHEMTKEEILEVCNIIAMNSKNIMYDILL